MNANELADALDWVCENHLIGIGNADFKATATMLRQQQSEIEALKANRKHDFGLGEASGFIKGHKENPYKAITNTKIEPTVVSYSYPVKEQDTDCQYCKQGCIRCDARKQLTDEEISQVYKEVSEPFGEKRLYEIHVFARAILRKAQEK